MNLLPDHATANFPVSPFWEQTSDHTDKVAKLQLTNTVRKRARHSHTPPVCALRLTLWTAAKSSADPSSGRPALTRKSFSTVYDLSKSLSALHSSDVKVMAANTVIETDRRLKISYAAIAFATDSGTYAVCLVEVGQSDFKLIDVGEIPSTPHQLTIIRGPTVVARCGEMIHICNPDSSTPVRQFEVSAPSTDFILASTDRDPRAVMVLKQMVTTGTWKVFVGEFNISGPHTSRRLVAESIDTDVTAAFLSHEYSSLFLASATTVLAVDVTVPQLLWRAPVYGRHGNVRALALSRGDLIVSFEISPLIWRINLTASKTDKPLTRTLSPLFGEKCGVSMQVDHGHFYAPWRNQILQLHDGTGMCCRDEEASFVLKTSESQNSGVAPSLALATEHLQQRVQDGIKQFMRDTDQYSEKVRMRKYISTLTADLARGPGSFPSSGVFDSDLRPFVFKPLVDEVVDKYPQFDPGERPATQPGTKVLTGGHLPPALRQSQLVRLITRSIHMDSTQQFVIFSATLIVLPQDPLEEPEGLEEFPAGEPKPLELNLNMRFDKPVSTTWTVERKGGLRSGDTVSLSANTVLANFANSPYPLGDLRILIRVDSADGRSQLLGTYSMRALLCADAPVVEQNLALNPFVKRFYVAALGPGAHLIADDPVVKHALADTTRVETQENSALITINASSGVDLAITTTRLRLCAGDMVRFVTVVEPSIRSLSPVEQALRAFEKEVEALQDSVYNDNVMGVSATDAQVVLSRQRDTDEAYGLLAELKLCLEDDVE